MSAGKRARRSWRSMRRNAKPCARCRKRACQCVSLKCPKYKPYYEASLEYPPDIALAAFAGTPPKDLQEATERGRFERTVISLARREDPACEDADAEYKQLMEDVRIGAIAAAATPPPTAPVVIPRAPTYTNCFETGNGFNCSTY